MTVRLIRIKASIAALAVIAGLSVVSCGNNTRGEVKPASNETGAQTNKTLSQDLDAETALREADPHQSSVGNSIEATSQGGVAIWQVLTLLLAVIATVAIVLVVRMYTWRRKLPDGQVSILPEGVISATDNLARINLDQLRATQTALAELKSTYGEIRDSFKIFGGTAAEKDAQIERLRQGSDKHVYRQFLKRFVRVLRLIESDIEEDQAAGKETASLTSIRNHLLDALADAGAEAFEPPSGSDFRKRSDVSDRPRIVATDDPTHDWLITRTLRAGFKLQVGVEPIIVERADVEIQRHGV